MIPDKYGLMSLNPKLYFNHGGPCFILNRTFQPYTQGPQALHVPEAINPNILDPRT